MQNARMQSDKERLQTAKRHLKHPELVPVFPKRPRKKLRLVKNRFAKREKVYDRCTEKFFKDREALQIAEEFHKNLKSGIGKDRILVRYIKQDLEKLSYQEFLKSDYWMAVRKMVISRDKFKCVKCPAKKNLHVHHKTYEHHFEEHKHLEDLETLCNKCHKVEHKR